MATKPTLIIDAKYCLLHRESSTFMFQLRHFFSSLEKSKNIACVFPSFEEAVKQMEKIASVSAFASENLRNIVSTYFGKKVDQDSITSFFYLNTVPIIRMGEAHFFDAYDDLFQREDFRLLEEAFDVFVYYKSKSALRRLVARLLLEKSVDPSRLVMVEKAHAIGALREAQPDKLFIVSASAARIERLIIASNPHLQSFSFKKGFLKFASPLIERKLREVFDKEAFERESWHQATVSLKHLRNRLSIVHGFNRGCLHRDQVVTFSVYFQYKVFYEQINNKVLIDYLPLIFLFQDPSSDYQPPKIDIIMFRNSLLFAELEFTRNQVADFVELIRSKLTQNQPLESMLIVNSFETAEVTFYRSLTLRLFAMIANQPELKNKLSEKFPGYSFAIPKSIESGGSDLKGVIALVEQAGLSFPVLVKTEPSNSYLKSSAHLFFVINSQEGLYQLFEKQHKNVTSENFIVQEIIPAKSVIKSYWVFNHRIAGLSNSLEFDHSQPLLEIDASKLKEKVVAEVNEEHSAIIDIFFEEMGKYNLGNVGVDMIFDEKSKTFYLIDLNQSTFSWLNHTTMSTFRELSINAFIQVKQNYENQIE